MTIVGAVESRAARLLGRGDERKGESGAGRGQAGSDRR